MTGSGMKWQAPACARRSGYAAWIHLHCTIFAAAGLLNASPAAAQCAPNEHDGDCNGNGVADSCDIASGFSVDANLNAHPDECTRIYVSAAASGADAGWSWSHAHRQLHSALDHARTNGDISEIWVAAGEYTPVSPGGDRSAAFVLVNGVRLLGGFGGDELRESQRNPAANPTILSGDLNGDDEPEWVNRQDNSLNIVVGQDLYDGAVLDGFTIRGGYSTSGGGSGLRLANCQARIVDCALSLNLTGFSHGGAVLLQGGQVEFSRCTFEQNYVHLGKGGAVYLTGQAGARFTRCRFAYNTSVGATNGTPEAAGAAIAHWGAGILSIEDCQFTGNVARGFYGSGSNGAYAGAIDHFGPGPMSIDRSTFLGNSSNAGGAIFTWGDATITNSVFARNRAPQFNSANGWGGQGGGIASQSYAGTTVALANCVFFDNSAEDAGGVGAYGAAVLSVANSILWNNTDNRGNIGKSQVSGADVAHCCIMNMLVAAPDDDPPDPAKFPGCTAADPQFADAAAADFHLLAGSSAIDAGRNDLLPAGLIRDREGRYRFLDDPAAPDVGGGLAPIIDMGAFEHGDVTAGDYNADGFVDLFDYGILTECFSGPAAIHAGPACEPFDLDLDGDVDLFDVAAFTRIYSVRPDRGAWGDVRRAMKARGSACRAAHVVEPPFPAAATWACSLPESPQR